jgi:hypothetical protein
MGRHAEASGTPLDLRRTAQLAGPAGGACWVLTAFVTEGGALDSVLLWTGGLLLSVALLGLGLLCVRSDVLVLRVFVALALLTLVWGVFALVRDSAADPGLVDAVFGAVVGLVAGVLGRRDTGAPRATL